MIKSGTGRGGLLRRRPASRIHTGVHRAGRAAGQQRRVPWTNWAPADWPSPGPTAVPHVVSWLGLIRRVGTGMDVSVRAQSFTVQEDAFAAFWARVAAGNWEPDSFAVIDRLVIPDTTFVDIGAWIGPLTLYAASVGGAVHAIEPDPVARTVLQANIGLNPRLSKRIKVHSMAIGDRTGPARLGNITSAYGGDSMSSLLYANAPVSWVVESTTLDQFLTAVGGPVPSLIKIDTEGTEVELLNAARGWLAATRPPLLLSVHARFWPDPYPRLARLLDLLSGYRELLTPQLSPIDPQTLLDQEHAHGLFELVAL